MRAEPVLANQNSENGKSFFHFFLKYKIVQLNSKAISIMCIVFAAIFLLLGFFAAIFDGESVFIEIPINEGCITTECVFFFHIRQKNINRLYFFISLEKLFLNNELVLLSFNYNQIFIGDEQYSDPNVDYCEKFNKVQEARDLIPEFLPGKSGDEALFPCGLYPLLYTDCEFRRSNFPAKNKNSH